MKRVIVVYKDSIFPNAEIAEINGGRSFGNTIYKRKRISEITADTIKRATKCEVFGEDKVEDINRLSDNTVICLLNSSFIITDESAFKIIVEKAAFAQEIYRVQEPTAKHAGNAMIIFPSVSCYREYVSMCMSDISSEDEYRSIEIKQGVFLYLGEQASFLDYLTGGFDARYFNSLEGDYYTVTKKSSNKDKIKREYNFYYMLPKSMQHYFVQPFNYSECEDSASYSMERYHMTDIAIRYVHGAIDTKEMKEILDQIFEFVKNRVTVTSDAGEVANVKKSLYEDKVRERINQLKKTEGFDKLEAMISSGTEYAGIDEIFDRYLEIYSGISKKTSGANEYRLVIGHGDLCFSNILYQKNAHIMRLIDPKGALVEAELYTDILYDLAKLSHSICGSYDFFNAGLYDITLSNDMKYKLCIENDGAEIDFTREYFAKKLNESGFDLRQIRILEVSLFLSMLPLHMDRPRKVFGFILNAINILDSIV